MVRYGPAAVRQLNVGGTIEGYGNGVASNPLASVACLR